MVISCLTVYAVVFSCVALLEHSFVTTNSFQRVSNSRTGETDFQNYIKNNTTINYDIILKNEVKTPRNHSDRLMHLQRDFATPRTISNDSNPTHTYFASFDPVKNVTKKFLISRRYSNFTFPVKNRNSISVNENLGRTDGLKKIQNFIEWDILRDYEKEIRIHYNGLTAKETLMSVGVDEETGKRQGLKLRQLTDGTHFIQLIYNFNNEIQDCEYIRQKGIVQKFLSSFRDNVEETKNVYERVMENANEDALTSQGFDEEVGDDYMEDVEGKIRGYSLVDNSGQYEDEEVNYAKKYRNVTFQIIRDGENLPEQMAKWMNYPMLKRKCKENHRILKQLVYNKNYGDAQVKKIAEEHIERRKRDIMDVLLVPGTKWCGKGRRATKYTSLGGFSRTDKCCRIHDTMCPHWIGSLEQKYGLFNWRINTIMHCRCDKRFRACLKMAKTGTANFVGKLFFNVVQTKCFVLKPQEVCLKYSWWGKCEKKEYRKKAYLKNNLSY